MNPFEAILESIGQSHLSVIPMRSNDAITVSDAPAKCALKNIDGTPYGVLFISSSVNPDLMNRSYQSSESIRKKIGSPLNNPILKPLFTGEYDGLSYLVWPWRNPLSQNRLVRAFKKRTLSPSVVSWLMDVTAKTKQPTDSKQYSSLYQKSYQFMATLLPQLNADPGLVNLNKHFASGSQWEPGTVVMHGDFWLDNILLTPQKNETDSYNFAVIDWAGGMLEGHPLYDLLRFLESAGTKPTQMKGWLNRYKTILECDDRELYGYLLAALGFLGAHLEQFPEQRYHQLVHRMLGVMQKAGIQF